MAFFGPIPLGVKALQFAVARNHDARLELFYIGQDDNLYHMWQIAVDSLAWSPPVAFPGASAKQIAAAQNADGRLELFYIGTNNHLYHTWQTAPAEAFVPATVNSWAGETSFVDQRANFIAVGQNRDGRIELFYAGADGHLYHDWQLAPANSLDPASKLNSWAGQTSFQDAKAEQIALGSNFDGRLEVFWIGSGSHLNHSWQLALPSVGNLNSWSAPTPFGSEKAQSVCVAANEDGRLETFYVGTGGHLYHDWQTAPANSLAAAPQLDSWNGQTAFAGDSARQVQAFTDADGVINLIYIGSNGNVFGNTQKGPATAANPPSLNAWGGQVGFIGGNNHQAQVAANGIGQLELIYIASDHTIHHSTQRTTSDTPLGSNFNQFVASDCENLLGVSIVINITQDVVSTYATGSPGYGFQLNAFSRNGQHCVWQQYCLGITGNQVVGVVNNWPAEGKSIINDRFNMVKLPDDKFPAGYQIQISLGNDADGNVSNATFAIFDQTGKLLSNVNKDVLKLGHGKVTNIAPITGLQVVLVGFDNSECAFLSTGAGTILYQADNVLQATSFLSDVCTANPGEITEEIANSVYSAMQAVDRSPNVLEQTFGVGLTCDQLARPPG